MLIQLSYLFHHTVLQKKYLLVKGFTFLFPFFSVSLFCLKYSWSRICSLIPVRHVACMEIIRALEKGVYSFLILISWQTCQCV